MLLFLVQAAAPATIPLNIPLLVIGGVLLLAGGLLYMFISGNSPGYRGRRYFAWVLVSIAVTLLFTALTPLLIDIAGKVGGIAITAAGSAALFLIFFFRGWRIACQAMDSDELRNSLVEENAELKADKTQLTEELDRRVAEIASLLKRKDELQPGQKHAFVLTSNEAKKVVIVTGRIQGLNNVDVWVNSENTHMYMARVTEHSVSATIRFLGAKREGQHVIDDKIADELSQTMSKRKSDTVAPTEVVVTKAGELVTSHNVKRIFHVAAVEGTPGYGFRPVQGVEQCVTNALREASSPGCLPLRLKSIVFPILGTGTGGGDVSEVAPKLLAQAVAFLADNRESPVEQVYFLAFTEYQLKICLDAMSRLPVRLVSAPAAAPTVTA